MENNWIITILLALLACAWIGDFINGIFQKKKVKADASLSDANAVQILVGSALTVVGPLKTQVQDLQKELTDAKSEVVRLIAQLQVATAENQRITAENQRITRENQRVTDENRRLRVIIGGSANGSTG